MADSSGILLVEAKLGQFVKEKQQIARIINPVTNAEEKVLAPFFGTVLGVAQNQFVNPGFMIFWIGIKTSEEKIRDAAVEEKKAKAAGK